MIRLDANTLAQLRSIRRRLGVSFVIVEDDVADSPEPAAEVVTVNYQRLDEASPVLEAVFTQHYDAICGAQSIEEPLPCGLRPGHKGEHLYGAPHRFRSS